MPVADFSGRWNWGYDGVLMFAPDASYGRPDDLRALVDAAHRRGLMVFLDVVYNHFGPEGNYLSRYAPQFFTREGGTPWGAAIDYSVPEVRAFAVENALHWIERYRFDGLRLDAVHAIVQRGTPSILEEISNAVGGFARRSGRLVHLILENDDNNASLLDPRTDPPAGKYRAQWNDDFHHAWHVLLTGETAGYYRDYADRPQARLARILSSGFDYQGEASAHRKGARRGEKSGGLPATAFLSFLQNHDQIGNRAHGERLDALADAAAIEAALAITLLAPMPPMMFMGEEWGALQPFPFFCDFTGELAKAVREGRRREFAEAYAHQASEGAVPDPLAEETFRAAVLDWDARSEKAHRRRLDLVTRLLATRRREIVPLLADLRAGAAEADFSGPVLTARWGLGARSLSLAANLSAGAADAPAPLPAGTAIWGGAPPPRLPPWSVYWALGAG
jgi:malto-oligosyltrehalose trehalohydrolase